MLTPCKGFSNLVMCTFNRRVSGQPQFSTALPVLATQLPNYPLNLDDEKLGHCIPDKSPDKSLSPVHQLLNPPPPQPSLLFTIPR